MEIVSFARYFSKLVKLSEADNIDKDAISKEIESLKKWSMSFFKDAFVEIPVEEKVSRVAPTAAEEQPVRMSGSEQPPEKSQKLEPGYFPLNPRGRIY